MRRDALVEPPRGVDVCDADPEVVDRTGLPLGSVVHRLGAVAVRVEQQAAVVVRGVLRTQTGRAVVPVTGVDARAPERIDDLARRCQERNVQPARHRMLVRRRGNREIAPLGALVVFASLEAEHPEHGVVEPLGGSAVGDADLHVVEHATPMPDLEAV